MFGVKSARAEAAKARAETAELAGRVETLSAPRPPAELTEEEIRELKVIWPRIRCQFCGVIHDGTTCPRIREIRYHPNGTHSRIIFWPDSEWGLPPDGSITAADVFGDRKTFVPTAEGMAADEKAAQERAAAK